MITTRYLPGLRTSGKTSAAAFKALRKQFRGIFTIGCDHREGPRSCPVKLTIQGVKDGIAARAEALRRGWSYMMSTKGQGSDLCPDHRPDRVGDRADHRSIESLREGGGIDMSGIGEA